MSLVLITGASGFLGSRIAAQCAERIPVRCTGRSAAPAMTLPDYCPADLTNKDQVRPLLAGVSGIIHSAGLAHQFGARSQDKEAFYRGNVVATENVMRAAIAAGVRHVVLVSSVAVYGNSERAKGRPVQPFRPVGHYGQSKLQAERRAVSLAEQSDTHLTILRMATIYGEGDPGNVRRLINTIDSGRFVWIGRGKNLKSLIHVDDAARACVQAVSRTESDATACVYDVAGEPCRMREVVTAIYRALAKRQSRLFLPTWLALSGSWLGAKIAMGSGFPHRVHQALRKWVKDDAFDGSEFSRVFDFRPCISLDEGLARETEWYRRQAA